MRVGSVTEIKDNEFRAGLTPADVQQYVAHGHDVLLQKGVGICSGYADEAYEAQGAVMYDNAKDVWDQVDLMVKIKEPMGEELNMMHEGQIVFTYFHMAADRHLTEALLEKKVSAVAYETVRDKDGHLPLLSPMSQIAGRLSLFAGAHALQKPYGGSGVLLSGVPGVRSANVLIIGGGVVGTNAAVMAHGIGSNVKIMDKDHKRLAELDLQFKSQVETLYSDEETISRNIKDADLVISTVLIPGASAPKLIKKHHIASMKEGSVIVDVAIDQGGSTELSRPATHTHPTYVENGVVMYCVSNMPGAVPFTATTSLTNATIQYGLKLADEGIEVILKNKALRYGLNTYMGHVTNQGVAGSLDLEYVDPKEFFV